MNCIGYVRVSTERQAGEQFTSLADQQRAIETKAAALGLKVGGWYRDEGASGATVEGRPAFREMLAFCESNRREDEDGIILVLNDSRFGRFPDPEEAAYWRVHLRRLGWVVRFCEGDEAENTTARTVMRAIGSAQASEYRENIRRNSRRGMRGAANQGYWTRRAPFGYRRQVVFPKVGRVLEPGERKADTEKVKLTPDPEEAAIVLWAFEQYGSGELSMRGLAKELEKRAPRRVWKTQTVRALLSNPAYTGDVVGGKRTEDDESFGLKDAHPAIVSRSLWAKVQKRLNDKPAKTAPSAYLLSGIMTCPHCGYNYTGGGGGRSRDAMKVREHRRFYRDHGGVEGHCPGRIGTVMRHIIDDATVETLTEAISSPAGQLAIAKELDRVLFGKGKTDPDAELRRALNRVTAKRDRLISLLADGTLQKEEAAPKLEALRSEIADIEAERERAKFEKRRADNAEELREAALEAAQEFGRTASELRESGRTKALRRYISPWLRGATFDKETRELALYINPVPSLLLAHSPGPGSR